MLFVVLLQNQISHFTTDMTQNDRDKIGNTIIYIAQQVKPLSKTKLLKLLFLMEEYSVKRFHTPFLGMAFEVWQAGPVLRDIFIDLSETPVLLDGYITKIHKKGKTYIEQATAFDDSEFSDNDMIVMDDIIKKYKNMTAKQLVDITHRKEGLWYKTAEQNNLLPRFKEKLINNTTIQIDLSGELSGCSRDFYLEQLDFLNHARENAI